MKKTYPILLVLLFVIVAIIFFCNYDKTVNLEKAYKLNWGIEMKNPESAKMIYSSGGINGSAMSIYEYTKENIDFLIKQEYFNKMSIGRVNYLLKNNFKFLNDGCNNCVFEYIDSDVLVNLDYYAYFTDGKWRHTLLILDVDNNLMYEMIEY